MNLRKLIAKVKQYFADPDYRFILNANYFHTCDSMPDREYLSRMYKIQFGAELDLENPKTFNEKLQWLKLYDRNPLYTVMVDKAAVKDYVADLIGKEYIIPTIGVWEKAEEIDFAALPEKFAIKCNHNSGLGMCICKDKAKLDFEKVKKGLRKGLKENYYLSGREWPYRDVPRRIVAEEYLENSEAGGLTDYKIHCFGGKAKFILICRDRFAKSGLTEDFYTPEWERMPLKRPKIPNAKDLLPKPEKLDEMIALAEKLSSGIPFLRVDFYFVEGKIYFSELTFFPASGFSKFDPPEWDETFGSWLKLPEKREE